MNKVHAMLILVVGTLLVVAFLPLIMDSISGVQYPESIETDTAVELLAVVEIVTTDNTIYEVNYIMVNGVELTVTTEYTFTSGVLTILASNSDVGDEIVTSYTYEDAGLSNAVNMLYLLPFLIVIVVVVYYTKFK